MKKVGMILVAVALLVLQIYAQNINPEELSGPELEKYNHGKDLVKFLEMSSIEEQKNIASEPEFIQGVKDSLKKEGGVRRMTEAWFTFREGESEEIKLSDEVKSAIWDALTPSERQRQFKDFLSKKFVEDFGVSEEAVKDRLKSMEFTDNEEWQGSRLGVFDSDGEGYWVDINDLHYTVTDIKFNNDGLELKYDTGSGLKKVNLNEGTINQFGEIVNRAGIIIGDPVLSGIESISLENGVFDIEFRVPGSKESTHFKANKETITKAIRSYYGEERASDAEELIRNLENPAYQEILKNLKFDSTLSQTRNNKLNVLYGGDYENEGVVEIDYDDFGRLEVKTSNGGNIVSTDSEGVATRRYDQFYSKNGIVNSKFSSGAKDEIAEFKFDFNGDLVAAKNGAVGILGVGSGFTSRNGFVEVEIIDEDNLITKAFKAGEGLSAFGSLEEIKALSGKIERGEIEGSLELELAKIVSDEIERAGVDSALGRELNNVFGVMTSSLERTSETLVNDLVISKEGIVSDEQNIARESISRLVKSQTGKVTEALLGNQNYLDAVATGKSEKIRSVALDITKEVVKDPELRAFLNSMVSLAGKNPEDLTNAKIDAFTSELFAGYDPDTSFRETIKANLPSVISNEKVVNAIESIYLSAEGAVTSAISREREKISKEGFPSYDSRLIVNVDSRTVSASGDKEIVFDASVPLKGFAASSTKQGESGENLVLKSNGHTVAVFDGDKTKYSRVVSNVNYQPIDLIVNTESSLNDKSGIGRLVVDGQGSRVEYPLVSKVQRNGPVKVVGVPEIGYYQAMNLELISGDPTLGDLISQDSRVRVSNYAYLGSNHPDLPRVRAIGEGIGAQKGVTEGVNRARQYALIDWFGKIENYAARIGASEGAAIGGSVATQKFLNALKIGGEGGPNKVAIGFSSSVLESVNGRLNKVYDAWGNNNGNFKDDAIGKSNYQSFARQTLSNYDSLLPDSARSKLVASLEENKYVYEEVAKFIAKNPSPTVDITPKGITTSNGASFNIEDIDVSRNLNGRDETKALNDAILTYQSLYSGIASEVSPKEINYPGSQSSSSGSTSTQNYGRSSNPNNFPTQTQARSRISGGLTGGSRLRPGSGR